LIFPLAVSHPETHRKDNLPTFRLRKKKNHGSIGRHEKDGQKPEQKAEVAFWEETKKQLDEIERKGEASQRDIYRCGGELDELRGNGQPCGEKWEEFLKLEGVENKINEERLEWKRRFDWAKEHGFDSVYQAPNKQGEELKSEEPSKDGEELKDKELSKEVEEVKKPVK
jgi:hypothetical protein